MSDSRLLVLDASIVLAHILDETEHERQLDKLFNDLENDQCKVLVPSLIIHEIANRLSRVPDFTPEVIIESLGIFATIDPQPDVLTKTIAITRQYKSTTWYDAIYHATALVYGGILVTADHKYYQATKLLGGSIFIENYR